MRTLARIHTTNTTKTGHTHTMEEILLEIARQTPLTGALIWAIIYFKKELKAEREENRELNLLIRDQQKEAIGTMNEANSILKELTSVIKYGKS